MKRPFRAHRTAAVFSGLVAAMLAAGAAQAQNANNTLSTGKYLTVPPVGSNTNTGSLTMNMIASPDGKWAVSTDMGFNENLSVINTTTNLLASSMTFGNPALGVNPDGLYYGLVFQQAPNNDGSYTLYASRGSAALIGVFQVSATGQLTHMGDITLQKGEFPAGLGLSPDGRYLYVADNEYYVLSGASATDQLKNVTAPGRLSVYDTTTGSLVTQLDLNGKTAGSVTNPATVPTITTSADSSSFPLAVTVANDQLYVTSQRDASVSVLSLSNPASPVLMGSVPTGLHPAGILASADGSRVFVANAHSDNVSIISTATNTVVGTIPLAPAQAQKLPGFTPLGMALAPNGASLYVAMGDMNAVADVALNGARTGGTVMGYIPAGWYPTAVVAGPVKQLLIANAKGIRNRYPNPGYHQFAFNSDPQYDLNLVEGTVEEATIPGAQGLVNDTKAVLANNRITGNTNNALPSQVLDLSGIKHVIYIIKENRTYDQVLGDLPQGNGDPALALFGANITPNLHALASRFVLLDNFYTCAEASGDGWPWSTQGLATEYVIKNLPYNYSDRGRNYDFEGQVNNYPVAGIPAPPSGGTAPVDAHGNPIVAPGTPFAGGSPAITDVSEAPNGHIWDDAVAHGLSIRDYGFFDTSGNGSFKYTTGTGSSQTYMTSGTGANEHFTYQFTPGSIPENEPAVPNLTPGGFIAPGTGGAAADFSLAGNTDIDFRKYDNAYPDSDAPYNDFLANGGFGSASASVYLYPKTAYGFYDEPSRFSEWNREFQLMIQAGVAAGQADKYVPNLMMVRFHHDHTSGLASDTHTPAAMVADNDYAVGQLVEAVSQSPIWNSTAIFVLEDDSQDGPDHVDCHRSPAYVISPWIKKSSVDHTFYNTDSILHTMELVLGLPSLSQYDAIATPIEDFDTTPSNSAVFTAAPAAASIFAQVTPPITEIAKNDPLRQLVAESDKMDFSEADDAPAQLLNEIIWKSVKGVNSKMPAPRHTVYPAKPAAAHPGKSPGSAALRVTDSDD